MALVVEGPEDTWQIVRTMIGATNSAEAAPGTIRGDLSILFTENLVHGSDSAESAAREIALWFPSLGLTRARYCNSVTKRYACATPAACKEHQHELGIVA